MSASICFESGAIAIAERDGAASGLIALDARRDRDRLARYPFYSVARGELEIRRGCGVAAREYFRTALALARNPTERRSLERRLRACSSVASGPDN